MGSDFDSDLIFRCHAIEIFWWSSRSGTSSGLYTWVFSCCFRLIAYSMLARIQVALLTRCEISCNFVNPDRIILG